MLQKPFPALATSGTGILINYHIVCGTLKPKSYTPTGYHLSCDRDRVTSALRITFLSSLWSGKRHLIGLGVCRHGVMRLLCLGYRVRGT